MISSNQPAAFHTDMICLRIIWRFEYFLFHIQPRFTFLTWERCKVNVCRKSFGFQNFIRFEFNIHFVCRDWYDFFIPTGAEKWFRFGTLIYSSQMCYQCLISNQINFLYWYENTRKSSKKLSKNENTGSPLITPPRRVLFRN